MTFERMQYCAKKMIDSCEDLKSLQGLLFDLAVSIVVERCNSVKRD